MASTKSTKPSKSKPQPTRGELGEDDLRKISGGLTATGGTDSSTPPCITRGG